MKFCHLNASLAVLSALAVGSCVDKDYNLDDIDTTMQFKIDNLVVPVNIDEINLSTIIDIEENGDIQIVDGEYAYVTEGDFSTASISIPDVKIKAATIDPISVSLDIPSEIKSIPAGVSLPYFMVNIPESSSDFEFSANNVTEDICAITRIEGNFDVHMKLVVDGIESLASSYDINNISIQLPAGLEFSPDKGSYNSQTGVYTFSGNASAPTIEINGVATAFNLPADALNANTHTFAYSGNVGIIGGDINVNPRADWTIPSKFGISLDVRFSDIEVKAINGVVKHSIANVRIPDINISDLPDVLAQPGTNIVLTNPRLYLDINNPLYTTGLKAQTGFEITSFHGVQCQTYAINDEYLTIAADPIDYLVLSPEMPDGAAGYTHVPFTGLRNVLSGDGVPDKLEVELTNPNIPAQTITNFPLGHNFGEISGKYRFVAPLQFGEGTQIVYKEVNDGWGSEDIENLTIERLEVSMTVSTTVPIEIELTGTPLNSRGQQMSSVTVTPLLIPANANGEKVTLSIRGTIRDLDGIEFTARAAATADASALSPDMTINISDLRPCVSGYYEKEF